MTPKEKAKELVQKLRLYSWTSDYDYAENGAENEYYNAKKCALIAVDEILDEIQPFELAWEYESKIKFWKSVKKEIEKL